MLKFAFLLLVLLNSIQISTAFDECNLQCIGNSGYQNYLNSKANLMKKEERKLSTAVGYVNSILGQEDENEKFIQELNFKKMKLQGAKLYAANREMNALDKTPVKYRWVQRSHVELCPEFRDLRNNSLTDLSIYNFTFLHQYDTFNRVLSEIPEPEMDVKNLNVFFYYFSNKQRRMEVSYEVHEFSQRLQCLQSIRSLDNKRNFEKMTDLYEAFCYTDKFSQYEAAMRYDYLNEEPVANGFPAFWIIFTVLFFIV